MSIRKLAFGLQGEGDFRFAKTGLQGDRDGTAEMVMRADKMQHVSSQTGKATGKVPFTYHNPVLWRLFKDIAQKSEGLEPSLPRRLSRTTP
ncbi:hypothetical protein FBY54_1854 [Zymomonas mobilis]|uniref:Uncharacterized protein n=1 Tax=Zymomonas mobilis subsp. mobilis (strain ATCC 10988 / DSM 424 / LMG 404 / NCIMB 8938 / NRRL B-806 / ZM1) TaxID=555217 RepID=A0A0H3G0M3_ZYMMA|nr:hypothetical protein Zmob_1780 [Zymomonas mobilis subsp. mobilis ATCC 10988]TQL24886.1 hypothetical protein FBY55_1857 [Zymomonas mobilis]TQL24976.1 hypothetical protein FBY54_1854 [Zymomonas mobilis]